MPSFTHRFSRGIRLRVWMTLGVFFLGCPHGDREPTTEDLPPLVTGVLREGALGSGQTGVYPVQLDAGDYVRLAVEQRGIDLVVSLADPHGREILSVDSPTGAQGTETLFAVAETSGLYRVELRPWSRSARGRYSIRIEERHPATRQDRRRALAARAFAAGERERGESADGSLPAAIARYEEALTHWQAAGEDWHRTVTRGRLVQLRRQRGEVQEAGVQCHRALHEVEALQDPRLEVTLLNDCGSVFHLAGRTLDARNAWEEALGIAERTGDLREQTVSVNNLALLHRYLGEPWMALVLYDRALEGWRRLGDHEGEAATLHNLAKLYNFLGLLPEAVDTLHSALALSRASSDVAGQAATLTALGDVHLQSGAAQEALTTLKMAIELREQAQDWRGKAVTLDRMAATAQALGRMEDARRLYREALDIFQQVGDRLSTAHTLASLGELTWQGGETQAASDLLSQALQLFDEMDEINGVADIFFRRARLHKDQGDLAAARDELEKALELVESMRTEVRSPELQASYFAQVQSQYDLYIEVLMALHEREPDAGHDVRAFEVAETRRARSLLEALALGAGEPVRAADRGLEERRALVAEEIAAREQVRMKTRTDETPEEPETAEARELRALLLERAKIETRLRRAGSEPEVGVRPLTAEEIQTRVLDPDTQLLLYSLGRQRSFVFLLGAGGFEAHVLPPRAEIEQLALRFHRLLTRSHMRSVETQTQLVAGALGEILLGPVAEHLDKTRLVVVTQGALQYIPFAALRAPSSTGAAIGEEAPPLVVTHEIVHLPSASVLGTLRQRWRTRPLPPKLLAVVADPVFQASDPRVTGKPASEAAPMTVLAELTRSVPDLGFGEFERLPASRREAETILELVPPAERFEALGFAARREMILGGGLDRYRILHFATHSFLHAQHPELSGVVLSLVDEKGRPLDGFLRAHEISQLHLPVELVVLSGCRTALGREVRGEGLVGLTQGFFQAGAARVIVSLWEVNDEGTAELMRRFYDRLLKESLSPAAALRAVQISMREDERWQAPSYWAGFTLQGEWR